MFFKKYIALYALLFINILFSSIISGHFIKTVNGLTAIENVDCGNTIICYDQKSLSTTIITHISIITTTTLVVITTEKGSFCIAPDQHFFDPIIQKWVRAQHLTKQSTFLNAQLQHCECLDIEIIHVPDTKIFHISTTYPHTFFITEQELLTHNTIPILIGAAWAFGSGLTFLGITLGTVILGGYVGVQVYNAQKQKDQQSESSLQVVCSSPSPDPDDDQNKYNFYQHIQSKFHKKFRHNRFGNFYHDPQTKLLWSKDNSGHGGSTFKVFQETSKGLKWIFDADILGNQIIGKHKGPIGIFIPYKELIRCP